MRYKCRPFTSFINCVVQLCRSVDHSSLHNELQFGLQERSCSKYVEIACILINQRFSWISLIGNALQEFVKQQQADERAERQAKRELVRNRIAEEAKAN